jgi:hypothetical protein
MLTLHFMPYEEIAHLSSGARIQRIMQSVKDNKIVILDGKLKKEEEVELIRTTMEEVNDSFRGIELQVWEGQKKDRGFFKNLKTSIAGMLAPDMISGFTIIGPAAIIKEIRKDPSKIMLITQNGKLKKRRP